jgi:hypothetical protein
MGRDGDIIIPGIRHSLQLRGITGITRIMRVRPPILFSCGQRWRAKETQVGGMEGVRFFCPAKNQSPTPGLEPGSIG